MASIFLHVAFSQIHQEIRDVSEVIIEFPLVLVVIGILDKEAATIVHRLQGQAEVCKFILHFLILPVDSFKKIHC